MMKGRSGDAKAAEPEVPPEAPMCIRAVVCRCVHDGKAIRPHADREHGVESPRYEASMLCRRATFSDLLETAVRRSTSKM